MIKEQLLKDTKTAMKSGDVFELGILRLLTSVLHNREIEKKAKKGDSLLSDEEIVQLLQTESKKRREAADLFEKGGRSDLAEKEMREGEIIARYLPRMMQGEELEKKVQEIMEQVSATDFPSTMKSVMAELRGKGDAKQITEIVQRKFSR